MLRHRIGRDTWRLSGSDQPPHTPHEVGEGRHPLRLAQVDQCREGGLVEGFPVRVDHLAAEQFLGTPRSLGIAVVAGVVTDAVVAAQRLDGAEKPRLELPHGDGDLDRCHGGRLPG